MATELTASELQMIKKLIDAGRSLAGIQRALAEAADERPSRQVTIPTLRRSLARHGLKTTNAAPTRRAGGMWLNTFKQELLEHLAAGLTRAEAFDALRDRHGHISPELAKERTQEQKRVTVSVFLMRLKKKKPKLKTTPRQPQAQPNQNQFIRAVGEGASTGAGKGRATIPVNPKSFKERMSEIEDTDDKMSEAEIQDLIDTVPGYALMMKTKRGTPKK